MIRIATLTMNPTIDVSYEVDRMFHTHKMRTRNERYDPGGGGINVARVFRRLGGEARCLYLSGGATGVALDGLIDQHGLPRTRIAIADETRVAAAVLECESGKEYRFTPPGPTVSQTEWTACLDQAGAADCDYFVASGSLPPGVPADFYARLMGRLRERGVRFVLDTSGEALKATLAAGGVHLVKPSCGELRQLTGQDLLQPGEVAQAAMRLVEGGQAEIVAVTMGHDGGVLARREGALFVRSLDIEAKSAVGAGDSFLAAMLHALGSGWDAERAFRFGMAGGAAAVLTPGSDLAMPDDINRLFAQVEPGARV